ncbi:MAG TPA: hypothetical protein VGV36_05950 [Solirubrobacteraceae bacterium]|nr:hypothetical protein [Solirubrobacteraceae bacterium]
MGDLSIYLNDHLATASAAVDLAGRQQGGVSAQTLARAREELAAERALLLAAMGVLGVRPDRLKQAAGRLGERVGRLKPNGGLLRRSPLSDVVEVEALALLGAYNLAALRTLRDLAEPRLAHLDLPSAVARGEERAGMLEADRAATAMRALRG